MLNPLIYATWYYFAKKDCENVHLVVDNYNSEVIIYVKANLDSLENAMAWNIIFYEKPNGKRPLEEFLDDLPVKAKAKLISYIQKFNEHGFQLPGNYLEKIEDNLWTLRPEYNGNEYRLFFCQTDEKDTVVFLHAILKKTRRLPPNDIETAKRRRNEMNRKK